MARKKLSEEERKRRRRERDKLRKRRQRARQKREREIKDDFLGAIEQNLPELQKPKGANPDRVKRCPKCGHYIPFCTCARDQDGNLIKGDGWLTSPV